MKISAGRDLVGYGAFLNETCLGGPSCGYGWRLQDAGWDSFHMKVGWKYWRTIIWNPCLCAAILMCQWDVFLGIIWVLFIIHCVWCQMPWPNDLATCLSQICLSWCPWVNLLHLSRCLCVFPMFFVVHISFSLIHTLFVLWQTYLVSLGNCSYDTPTLAWRSLATTESGHLRPQNVTFADRANKTSTVHAVTCDHTSRSLATKNWDHLASLGSLVPMHGVGGVGGGVGW